jgi:hypothetical protein
MTTLKGFGSLSAIPEEKITDKITRRVLAGGVEHEGWFQEDTEVVDIFVPPREDFLVGGTPAYMREK